MPEGLSGFTQADLACLMIALNISGVLGYILYGKSGSRFTNHNNEIGNS